MYFDSGAFLGLEATAFYTHFTNRIVPDYETNANQIIYDNLDGFAVSKGLSINTNLNYTNGLKFTVPTLIILDAADKKIFQYDGFISLMEMTELLQYFSKTSQ